MSTASPLGRVRWRVVGTWFGIALLLIVPIQTIATLIYQGGDFYVYLSAGRRLIEGESLYRESLLTGASTVVSAGEYLYPPLLAQLTTPFALLSSTLDRYSFVLFSIISAAIFFVSLAMVWRSIGGRITLFGAGVTVLLLGNYFPFYSSLVNGNVSLLLGAAVSLALLGHPMLGAAVGGMLKVLPGSLVLMARQRLHWRRDTALAGALLALSVLASPLAWQTYVFEALPATLSNEDPIGLGGNPAAIARLSGTLADLQSSDGSALLASLAQQTNPGIVEGVQETPWAGLPSDLLRAVAASEQLLRIGGLLFATALLVAGFRAAADRRRLHVAATYLAVGSMLIPWILWSHYLVVLIPPALIAWRVGSHTARVLLGLGFAAFSPISPLLLGGYLPIPISMFLLLAGIARTRLSASEDASAAPIASADADLPHPVWKAAER